MARYIIPTDATIKAVRSGDPRKRLTDGDGLYLLLFVKGGARLAAGLHVRRAAQDALARHLSLHDVGDRAAQGRCSA
jgi:hypothetical protein